MIAKTKRKLQMGILMLCVLIIGGVVLLNHFQFFEGQEEKVSSADVKKDKDDTSKADNELAKRDKEEQDTTRKTESEKDTTKKETKNVVPDTKENTKPVPVMRVQLPLEQRIQETNYYCIPTCLQMAIKYKKNKDVSQKLLAQEMNAKPATGTEYVDLIRVANKYLFNKETIGPNEPGYRLQTIARYDKNPKIAEVFEQRVKQNMDSKDPVFVGIDLKALYPSLPTVNHWVLLTGYTLKEGTNAIDYFYYIDPYYVVQDKQYGGLKKVKKDELIHAIVTNDEPAYVW